MILEVQHAIDEVAEMLAVALVDAAVQVPSEHEDERIVTTVVPWHADGDLVAIEGIIDISAVATAIVEQLGLGRTA